MSSGLFGVRSARRGGSQKKQVKLETSLNFRCAAHAVDTSRGIYRRKRTYPHVPPIAIISKLVATV